MAVEFEAPIAGMTTVPFGSTQAAVVAALQEQMPALNYLNPANWGDYSIQDIGGDRVLRTRGTVGANGTKSFAIPITTRDHYFGRYSVMFESTGGSGNSTDSGFDFGDGDGEAKLWSTGIKQPGFMKGNPGVNTGGALTDQTFSARLMVRGGKHNDASTAAPREVTGLELYGYFKEAGGVAAGTEQSYRFQGDHTAAPKFGTPGGTNVGTANGQYGSPNFPDIPTDTWIHVMMEVYAPDSAAGYFKAWWIVEGVDADWQEQLYVPNIRWMGAGNSGMDALLFQNYWGGASIDWYPDRVPYLRYKDFGAWTTEAEARTAFGTVASDGTAFSTTGATRYIGNDTSRVYAYPSPAPAGSYPVIVICRGNASPGGQEYDHANAPGFTEVAHLDPVDSFRGIVTVLRSTAPATGGETSVTIAMNEPSGTEVADGDAGVNIFSAFATGIDPTSLTVAFSEVSGTTWTYPADSLDHNLHFNTSNALHSEANGDTLAYPSGDTNIEHTPLLYRSGGIAISGGNTTSGTFTTGRNGVVGTISAGNATLGPTVSFTLPNEGEELEPETDIDFATLVDPGAEFVDEIEFEITRASDGFYYEPGGTNFQAAASTQTRAITPPNGNPFGYTAGTAAQYDEAETYTIRFRAQGTVNGYGPWASRTVSAWTWDNGPTITATMAANGTPFEFVTPSTPTANETGVDRTSVTINGTAPTGATGHRARIVNNTTEAVVVDWTTPTVNAGANTWTITFTDLPAGTQLRAEVEID